jgi:hypothetical protein
MGIKPKDQKEADEADGQYEHTPAEQRDLALGKKTPRARKELDALLARITLEARHNLERGGKVCFDFRRRQAVLTIIYPDASILEDYEGSDV